MNTEIKKPDYVPLTNDILFKDTFGLPSNVRFLEYLLEAYYDYPTRFLKDKLEVHYESTLDKTRYQDKNFRSDLKVIIDKNIICNIEMYSSFNFDSFIKSKHYIMRIYSTQIGIGEDYSSIKKVTQINFIDKPSKDIKVMIDDEIKSTLYFGNEKNSSDLSADIIRLDLARKIEYNQDDRFMRILKFLGAESKSERESIAKGDEVLMEINKWIDEYMTEDEWWRKHNDVYWSKREGISEGKAAGLIEGKAESKIEIAKAMLADNMNINNIAKYTGLSINDVKKIQSENK